VPHLERILEDGHELLDLAIVKNSRGYAALGGKTLQQEYPLSPFPVFWSLNSPHLWIDGDRELVLCHEIKCTLGQAIIDPGKHLVLFLNYQIGRQMWQILLLLGNIILRRPRQQLMWSIKFITVLRTPLWIGSVNGATTA